MSTVEPITGKIAFDDFAAIRESLLNTSLSRTFDRRTYDEGNVRYGVVSIMHGIAHRDRRRLENSQFKPAELHLYETELFPPILESMVAAATASGETDLYALGEQLSVVLAARRAGFDLDADDPQQLIDMVHFVDQFSQASAILDAKDPEAVRGAVKGAHVDFHEQFGVPSIERRQQALNALERGEIEESDLPHDILTNLLRHRADENLGLGDMRIVIREAGTYLQGGTHTSGQTLVNTIDLLLENRAAHPEFMERVKTDITFAQRCMHESLRLRPTTPEVKRRAEVATTVAGVEIPEGTLVVLDLMKGNRDVGLFGDDADEFNPDRSVVGVNPLWGLSFGAGAHICPGFKVAGGLQQPPGDESLSENHLFGLVANMLQSVVQRDPDRHPNGRQMRDDRTERFTRWSEYWTIFANPNPVSANHA
jgi:cytochrome P450